ncbi:hypothetical protein BKA64DRAFT_686632 [Cadophora sp. MPI-SDFR-AT-0126]|nr:hypothetical protein BKA64DRAFT_686632 [Leotiomycetes sp. MPI-SDFR-AT-0126]
MTLLVLPAVNLIYLSHLISSYLSVLDIESCLPPRSESSLSLPTKAPTTQSKLLYQISLFTQSTSRINSSHAHTHASNTVTFFLSLPPSILPISKPDTLPQIN